MVELRSPALTVCCPLYPRPSPLSGRPCRYAQLMVELRRPESAVAALEGLLKEAGATLTGTSPGGWRG